MVFYLLGIFWTSYVKTRQNRMASQLRRLNFPCDSITKLEPERLGDQHSWACRIR